MDIYKMFLYGTVMICVTFLSRLLLKKWLPRFTYVLMWYISALRLIIPFEIKFSLSAYSAGYKQYNLAENSMPSLLSSERTVPIVPSYSPSYSFDFLKTIWIIGAVIMFIYFLSIFIAFKVKTKQCSELDLNIQDVKKLKRKIKILECSKIDTPLTYGIIFPKILLPKYDEGYGKEIQYILLHEYTHIKRFDSAGKLLLAAVLCINWFNPMVWLMFILANHDIEISCDEAVINMSVNNKEYAMALIISEEKRSSKGLAVFTGFSKNIVKERICYIMKFKRKNKLSVIGASAIIILSASAFATSPVSSVDTKNTEYNEDAELVSQSAEFIWPVDGCYNITFGYNEEAANGASHKEIDISGQDAEGKSIYAAADGTIENAEYDFKNGYTVTIAHENGLKTVYSHCKEIFVSSGQKVLQGETIASLGNTGFSTGAHLGFSVIENNEYLDPMTFFE